MPVDAVEKTFARPYDPTCGRAATSSAFVRGAPLNFGGPTVAFGEGGSRQRPTRCIGPLPDRPLRAEVLGMASVLVRSLKVLT